MNQEKIGKFIAKSRKEQKLTQEALAEKLGVNNRSISRWENGKYLPDMSQLEPLSKILNISINELLSGEKINQNNLISKNNEILTNTITYTQKKIKNKKRTITILIIILLLLIINISFFITDYNRIISDQKPNYMFLISKKNNAYTYIGPGYKLIRNIENSVDEPLSKDKSVKFGIWFFSWYVNIPSINPTPLIIINNEKRIIANIGSYCLTENKNDMNLNVCSDSIPFDKMKYKEILTASPNDIITISSNTISIKKITFYDEKNSQKLNIKINNEKYSFTVPQIKGKYYVTLETTSTKGNCWYAFKIEIT